MVCDHLAWLRLFGCADVRRFCQRGFHGRHLNLNLNLNNRSFAELTNKQIRRGVHKSGPGAGEKHRYLDHRMEHEVLADLPPIPMQPESIDVNRMTSIAKAILALERQR